MKDKMGEVDDQRMKEMQDSTSWQVTLKDVSPGIREE